MEAFKSLLVRLATHLPRPIARFGAVMLALATRGMTLGVRALVINADGEIFLVRHTYVPGWHFPGGGVERTESVREALDKELAEEANMHLSGEPELFHIYKNAQLSRYDHVALFICRDVEQAQTKSPDHEIAEARFFPLTDLPADITQSTRTRLREVFDGAAKVDIW